ncbi:hypothetical protein LTR53_020456, partial [Teratosphaeriaceae sp. CCFEE 6253]
MPLQSAAPAGHSRGYGYGDEVEMIDHPAAHPRSSADHGMMREKLSAIADVNSADSLENQDETMNDETLKVSKSTAGDAAGMKRMGKQQQL